MDSLITNLMQLGLKEYEARIYVALAGLGEANVRRIHEVSGVPRPRVYDVLNTLAARGFLDIRQGSPLMYCAVRPERVISYLKREHDTAAQESLKALKTLSLDAQQHYSPIWYVQGDRTIQRYFDMVVEGVTGELIVLCFNAETLKRFQGSFARIARDHSVQILFPKGLAVSVDRLEGVAYREAGTLRNFFGVNIFEKVYAAPITREGVVFRLECILLADDRESMLIYTLNGNRMAVIITLPFITSVQNQLFRQMVVRGRPVNRRKKKSQDARKTKKRDTTRSLISVEA